MIKLNESYSSDIKSYMSRIRRMRGRRIKEAVGESFVEFGTHELTQYLPIDELNACIQVINYIDDFKENADDYFLKYLQ